MEVNIGMCFFTYPIECCSLIGTLCRGDAMHQHGSTKYVSCYVTFAQVLWKKWSNNRNTIFHCKKNVLNTQNRHYNIFLLKIYLIWCIVHVYWKNFTKKSASNSWQNWWQKKIPWLEYQNCNISKNIGTRKIKFSHVVSLWNTFIFIYNTCVLQPFLKNLCHHYYSS